MIETKQVAGTSSHGTPVVYVLSKGGLHAFFTKDSGGDIITLGTAPHRAIAQWMAEKRDPDLKWKQEFIQKKEMTHEDIMKSDVQRFKKLKELLFYPGTSPELVKNQNQDAFIVYDTKSLLIGVMDVTLIKDSLIKGSLDKFAIVRDIGLTSSPSAIEFHPAFADCFEAQDG